MRVSSPLVSPVITEDEVDFLPNNQQIKGFAYDFSYHIYKNTNPNDTVT